MKTQRILALKKLSEKKQLTILGGTTSFNPGSTDTGGGTNNGTGNGAVTWTGITRPAKP